MEPPTFPDSPCAPGVVANAAALGQVTTATWSPPRAQDNGPGALTLTPDRAPGAAFPPGATAVTYTATDAAGNNATCTFDVTVVSKSYNQSELMF